MSGSPSAPIVDPGLLTIRVAGPADLPAVRDVTTRAFRQYEGALSADTYTADLANLLDVESRLVDTVLLVAEIGDRVVGTVTYCPHAERSGFGWPAGWAGFRALAVDPEHRGLGAGGLLVEAVIDRASLSGVPVVAAHTAEMMTDAVRLYERRGFVRDRSFDIRADDVLDVEDRQAPMVIAYRLDIGAPVDTYAFGRSESETRRLMLQHQIYSTISRDFFTSAGVTRGMKVLDLGSGAGDVALLVGDIVGPEGAVVGVDMNGDILDTARSRVRAAGLANVEFHRGDLDRLDGLPTDFDAVVGRWILMYLADPADLLRRLHAHLKPGGVVAFLESADLTTAVHSFPATPVHDLVARWTIRPEGSPGPTLDMGLRLYRTFIDAGLPAPQLRAGAPVGGGPDWPGYAFVAESVRSLLPVLERAGTVTAEQADVATLADRLRDEVVATDGVQLLPTVIGASTRAHHCRASESDVARRLDVT